MKKTRVTLLLGLLVLGSVIIFTLTRKKILAVNSTQNSDDSMRQSLYIPSPFEIYILSNKEDLWPKRFSTTSPLVAERIPEFYSAVKKLENRPEITDRELEIMRFWSVMVNANHMKILQDVLISNSKKATFVHVMNSGLGGDSRECSLFKQEKAYRLYQFNPEIYEKEAFAYLSKCDKENVLIEWKQLEKAMIKKDMGQVEILTEKLRTQGNVPDRKWTSWFKGELARVAWMLTMAKAHDGKVDSVPKK